MNHNRLRNDDGQSPRISKTQIVIPDDHWKHSTEVKCDDHDRPSRIGTIKGSLNMHTNTVHKKELTTIYNNNRLATCNKAG